MSLNNNVQRLDAHPARAGAVAEEPPLCRTLQDGAVTCCHLPPPTDVALQSPSLLGASLPRMRTVPAGSSASRRRTSLMGTQKHVTYDDSDINRDKLHVSVRTYKYHSSGHMLLF